MCITISWRQRSSCRSSLCLLSTLGLFLITFMELFSGLAAGPRLSLSSSLWILHCCCFIFFRRVVSFSAVWLLCLVFFLGFSRVCMFSSFDIDVDWSWVAFRVVIDWPIRVRLLAILGVLSLLGVKVLSCQNTSIRPLEWDFKTCICYRVWRGG